MANLDLKYESILALDIGQKRIGVAVANLKTKLPRPEDVIAQSPTAIDQIAKLVTVHKAGGVVIGLPRNLDGEDTAQTEYARAFGHQLQAVLPVPVYWIDEALTSRAAEAALSRRRGRHQKEDIDALAACIILADFFDSAPRELTI